MSISRWLIAAVARHVRRTADRPLIWSAHFVFVRSGLEASGKAGP
ncbi:hypothetical protein HMPREF9594_02368 [Cutibacterium acnes HL005PA1]|nr:hypothetical protein HMPREF9594_02368 [Cutibacterium acnes HL005PA1]